MKKFTLHIIGLVATLLLLPGCFAQKTPQEVTQAFWESVINNDSSGAVKYSTLTDTQAYDGFSKDWSGAQLSWGKLIIEGQKANIASVASSPGAPQPTTKKFITYLVQQNDEWKVDYVRTKEAMRDDLFTNMFDQLSQLSDNIAEQFKASSDKFSTKMERISKELEELSNSMSQQATESINEYAEALRKSLDELAASVERALKEQQKKLSNKDKRILTQVIDDLNKDSESLSEPNLQSIANGTKGMAKAQYRLQTTDDNVIGKYKQQWHKWSEKFEADVQKMLDDISVSAESHSRNKAI